MFRKRRDELLARMGLDQATLRQAADRIQVARTMQEPAAVAYQQRLQRVAGAGVEMPATLRSFAIGQAQPQIGAASVQLELTVEPPGDTPYEVSIDQLLPAAISQTLAAGQRLTVKVAPDDPQCVMLWNTPNAAGGADPDTGRPLDTPAPAASTADRIARLEKLQGLRNSGVLSEDEFLAQKAKILAS
jgi:putative oligomerization/nucleic acid binding protein